MLNNGILGVAYSKMEHPVCAKIFSADAQLKSEKLIFYQV